MGQVLRKRQRRVETRGEKERSKRRVKKENGRPDCSDRPFEQMRNGLQRLNVRGLQALGAADDFEFDRLAVIQRLVAIRLDRGKMYEYIFPGLALDEAKAFAGVEPLYCSLFFAHFVILFSFKSYLVPRKPAIECLFCVQGLKYNPKPRRLHRPSSAGFLWTGLVQSL